MKDPCCHFSQLRKMFHSYIIMVLKDQIWVIEAHIQYVGFIIAVAMSYVETIGHDSCLPVVGAGFITHFDYRELDSFRI